MTICTYQEQCDHLVTDIDRNKLANAVYDSIQSRSNTELLKMDIAWRTVDVVLRELGVDYGKA